MRKKDLETWLNNSVTKDLFSLIKEHREASFQMVTQAMMNANSIADIDLCKIAEYRGQVQSLDLLLDIEEFLDEKIELRDKQIEVLNEKVDSIRS